MDASSQSSNADDARQFVVPRLATRQLYLRPLNPDDYKALKAAEEQPDLLVRWRFRGATPSPDVWLRSVWSTTLAQFLVIARSGDRPRGLVVAYEADYEHRHARIAATSFSAPRHEPMLLLGLALFIDYVFTCFDFRKLYMDVPEYNMDRFKSGIGRYFDVEAQLREHRYFAGRYWDEFILALYRERWYEQRSSLIPGDRATGN